MDSEEGVELGIQNMAMDDIQLNDEKEQVKDREKMNNGKENNEDKKREKENCGNKMNSSASIGDDSFHDTAFWDMIFRLCQLNILRVWCEDFVFELSIFRVFHVYIAF